MNKLLGVMLAICALGCGNKANGPCSGSGLLSAQVTNAGTGEAVYQALVVIERGALNNPNPDPSKGNPSFIIGQATDYGGNFSTHVSCGLYGVHFYAVNFLADGADITVGTGGNVTLQPLPSGRSPPTVSNVSLNNPSVKGGAKVTISAQVAAPAGAQDPLSDQVIVTDATNDYAAGMNPPSPGSATGYPDGMWTQTFNAPAEPGGYQYSVIASTISGAVAIGTVALTVQLSAQ